MAFIKKSESTPMLPDKKYGHYQIDEFRIQSNFKTNT